MNVLFVAATAALGSSLLAQASISDLIKRQNNANSTCSVYGVDFQNGGSYFINSGSNGDFTAVSEFEGCTYDLRGTQMKFSAHPEIQVIMKALRCSL